MLIYILDGLTLEKIDVIEEYESCVWTERFVEAGDVNLQVGATHENAARLRPRTILLHEDSDEPMRIETREVKDGAITVVGKTIESFFNERYIDNSVFDSTELTASPPNIIRMAVDLMQNHQSGSFAFPNLRTYVSPESNPNYPDTGVIEKQEKREKAYDFILRVAQKFVVGIRVKRQFNTDLNKYEYVFVIHRGLDRTSGNGFVRLSSEDDNFVNIHEVYSVADAVDVVVVHPPPAFVSLISPVSYPANAAHGGPENFAIAGLNPFDWHIREIDSEDITVDYLNKRLLSYYGPKGDLDPGQPWSWVALTLTQKHDVLYQEMRRKGEREWAQYENKPKVVIDGEIAGEVLKFGRDYRLGDTVQVQGDFTGGRRTAMITEYIRSADGSGSRAYPTLAQPLVAEEGDIYFDAGPGYGV